jgi:hypothetical protein
VAAVLGDFGDELRIGLPEPFVLTKQL